MNVIVITGASSGMGREFALQLDRKLQSIDVFWLVARRTDRLKELAAVLHHQVKLIPLDLSFEPDLHLFGEIVKEEKPVVRMLVNCAGYGMMGDFLDIPVQEQTGQIDVNCRALTFLTHACIPYMRQKSRIIQLASSAAFLPQPGFAVYAATKAYVLSFSMALREELRKKQIYVTTVCPGPVQTPFFDTAERYGQTLAIKKYTMQDADRVVREALAASCKRRSLSVCGGVMRLFYGMTCILPHAVLIRLTGMLRDR